jgi:hypothetical protein
MSDFLRPGDFPKQLYVVQRSDGDERYFDAIEDMDDWKSEYIDNSSVAIYELKGVGRMVLSRRFVLPPGETR